MGSPEQHFGQQLPVPAPQLMKLVRHGEDHVEVIARQ